jgi:hypothetical protein
LKACGDGNAWPAYGEGRLSKEEYDARLDATLSGCTYADLDQIVSDLPARRRPRQGPVPGTNRLAVASLACGLAQLAVGPLATIPAIALGYVARGQIRRSGEQGAGLALAGLILGWAAVILGIVLVVASLTDPGCAAPCACTRSRGARWLPLLHHIAAAAVIGGDVV